jgi:CBS domain-containing protein
MRARDIMTANVVTVGQGTDVTSIARTLIERGISAVPVVDEAGHLVGIVSEGDLMRRAEAGTDRQASWWLELFASSEEKARDYAKSHGLTAKDVMTRSLVTVTEDATLGEIATLLERRRIKRVPVVRDGAIVGIVSRANLLHGLVAREASPAATADDATIREHIVAGMKAAGISGPYVNVIVAGGVVQLWGVVASEAEKDAIRIAAETAPGVKTVENNVSVNVSPVLRGGWA